MPLRPRIVALAACLAASCIGGAGAGDAGRDLGLTRDIAGVDVAYGADDVTGDPAGDPGAATDESPADPGIVMDVVEVWTPEPGLATKGRVYAHTSDALYEWTPGPTPPKKVAAFQWPADGGGHQMTDIAVDRDGRLYAISFDALYRCNAQTAACDHLADLDGDFNGLTVVPIGTISATDEAIVAISSAGGWYEVQVQGSTAQLVMRGTYGSGYSSAGDAYSIENLGTFAAVNSGSGGTHLVQVDPATGKVVKEIDTIQGNAIYGLAGLGGKVYALDEGGAIFVGDVVTGQFSLMVPASQGQPWWGAGVTTRGN